MSPCRFAGRPSGGWSGRFASFGSWVAVGVALLLLGVAPADGQAAEPSAPPAFPGTAGNWNGFARHDFEIDGKTVTVVVPPRAAPGRPWVWHGEFFGHKPEPDVALLKRGFHAVYLKVPDMLGSPTAVKHWEACYAELVGKYSLAPKVALVGLSRGGLYVYNFAAANPEKVACIYGDAPVCDFKSWPGGKGTGKGSARDWKLVLEKYGFADEAAALAYAKNPVDNLAPLAAAKVPALHVYGDADDVVPWEENTGKLAERYRKLGGKIVLIPKPGIGHHPHGLTDPTPIVDFIALHASVRPTIVPVPAVSAHVRDGLGNVAAKLKEGKPVKIGYLGGSITAANGWRVKTREWFAKTYPQAKVEEIHAAIGGTGSDLGVFRVERDALRHGPDLLFVEFAVNDGDAPPTRILQAMEGIVRQTWARDPRTDICFVYTYRVGYEKELRTGVCPRAAGTMELLADHYGIPSINFALEVVEREKAGKLIFQSDKPAAEGVLRFSSDGVHPLDEGHMLYAEVAAREMPAMLALPAVDHAGKLAIPCVPDHWQAAKMVPLTKNLLSEEWRELPADANFSKSFGLRLGTIWEATRPGARLTFKFRGATAKLYDLLGPDGGQVRVTVDGKPLAKPLPRFDKYCTYHRIGTLGLADGLDPTAVHTVTVEIDPEQPDRSEVASRLKDPETELKSPKFQGTNVRAGQLLILGDLVE